MFEFIHFGAEKLQTFLLIIVRASGLMLFSPILGHRSVPKMARAGLVLLFGVLLTSVMPPVAIPEVTSLLELAGIAIRELLVGTLIGFMFMLLFYAAQSAGSLVGYQMALAMAAVVDPTTQSRVAIVGQFWFLIATLIFLSINGHHLIITAFHDSFRVIPLGQVVLDGSTAELIIRYTAYVFVIALKIAAPVMVTLFLTDVAMGVVAKMMPTMNVFIVSFGLKIGVGLLVVAMSLPVFNYVLEQTTNYLNRELEILMISMGRA